MKTTNIDYFLSCENLDYLEDSKSFGGEDDEEDPAWNDIDVGDIKMGEKEEKTKANYGQEVKP